MVFCTLFDSNYLDKGLVMYESLQNVCENSILYTLAMDMKCYSVLVKEKRNNLIPVFVDDILNDDMRRARKNRSQGEFCWTCSSYFLIYVLEKCNEQICTYIDSDLYFYANPKCLLDEMKEKSVQIVEHRFPDSLEGRFASILSGRFCVQFNTFKNEPQALNLLKEWNQKCINSCSNNGQGEVFGDQKYLEDWDKYPYVSVLKNMGGGVAPWNVKKYSLIDKSGEGNGFLLREKDSKESFALVFYHYHNIQYINRNCANINVFTHYWNVDKKLIQVLYPSYLNKCEQMKQYLESTHNILPIVFSHPGLSQKNESLFHRFKRLFDKYYRYRVFVLMMDVLRKTRRRMDLFDITEKYI